MRSLALLLLLAGAALADTSSRGSRRTGPVTVVMLWSRGPERQSHARLREMGVDLKVVGPDGLAAALKNAEVLYLSSEWAAIEAERKAVADHAKEIETLLRRGGGLFVSQPNVTAKIEGLPLELEVGLEYNSADSCEIEGESKLFEGLKPADLPFACDTVKSCDKAFRVVARGKPSGSPSLLLADWRGGRVVVNLDNDNVRVPGGNAVGGNHASDLLMQRLIEWLVRRPVAMKKK
jgi:hypothetical protein